MRNPKRSNEKDRNGDRQKDTTPQNGKQILIGQTAETLMKVYRTVLLEKDALGSNSIRIQAKNNKTLNSIAENLAKLEKRCGPYQGVRVSQAVRTGSMKKGVNVLLVFRTVDQAFEAITFMACEGFKVQTVIPRRLREIYGIHPGGMKLVKKGTEVPIEIPESELPPELRRDANPPRRVSREPQKQAAKSDKVSKPKSEKKKESKSNNLPTIYHPLIVHEYERILNTRSARIVKGNKVVDIRDPQLKHRPSDNMSSPRMERARRIERSPLNRDKQRGWDEKKSFRRNANSTQDPRYQRDAGRGAFLDRSAMPKGPGRQAPPPRFAMNREDLSMQRELGRHAPGTSQDARRGRFPQPSSPNRYAKPDGQPRYSSANPYQQGSSPRGEADVAMVNEMSMSSHGRSSPAQSMSADRYSPTYRNQSEHSGMGHGLGNSMRPSMNRTSPRFRPDGRQSMHESQNMFRRSNRAYKPPLIHPDLFPDNEFKNDMRYPENSMYMEEEMWEEENTYGYSQGDAPFLFDYHRDRRENTPPNMFAATASQQYFHPSEFHRETLPPLKHRRDQFYRDHPSFDPKNGSRPKNRKQAEPLKKVLSDETLKEVSLKEGSKATKEEETKLLGLELVPASKLLLAFAKKHTKYIVEFLCNEELTRETEYYYIWKYVSAAVGVEVTWSEADGLKTDEIVDKAKKHVQRVKSQIKEGVKLDITDRGFIVAEEYVKPLLEMVDRLEDLLKMASATSSDEKDPFDVFVKSEPESRAKFQGKSESDEEKAETEKPDAAKIVESPDLDSMMAMGCPVATDQNWVVAVNSTKKDTKFVLYDCDYCRSRGFHSEGHWELNCYYYLTGSCPLCGSENHISPYCPTPPKKLNFHQSVMYVRQLAFYYGPRVLKFFPDIYDTLQTSYNDLVVWDPVQNKLVVQPIITNEPVILWRQFDQNNDYAGTGFDTFPVRRFRPSPMLKALTVSPDVKKKRSMEQQEEIVEINAGEISEYNDSPVLHPVQQKEPEPNSPGSNALLPFNGGGGPKEQLEPSDHLELIRESRNVIPLTLPRSALDPLPFPNLPPAERNELIRRIQSGYYGAENLVYPILPVPSSTVLIPSEAPSTTPKQEVYV